VKADDFEDDPSNIQALSGGPPSGGADLEGIGGLLIEIICALTKAHLLLADVDEDEMVLLRQKVAVLQTAASLLPSKAPPKRRVGFKVKPKRRR
jgi:molybdenum-dependent DNA-binding transcriptional regulator ModE